MAEPLSILFRCDGAQDIGLGHVVRCLALADELKNKHGCRVTFATHRSELGINIIKAEQYPVICPDKGWAEISEEKFLEIAVKSSLCTTIIMDFREKISLDFLNLLRQQGIMLVDIDDPDDKRLAADMAFYPPVPQVKKMDWTRFKGQLFTGWEWVILRKEFAAYAKQQRKTNDSLHILVTMGGSDPAGFTLKALEALDLLEEEFETTVVLGPGFFMEEQLQTLLQRCRRNFTILRNVSNMPAVMAEADLAIASFGVTAYELAYMGVPAMYMCLTDDHAESCEAFVDAGIAINLGVLKDCKIGYIANRIQFLIRDDIYRCQMRTNARILINSYQTRCIASKIISCFERARK
ncbi:MAG: UDP-2,4-diacetamido-2,4,6-trideoxy-beta-L-altropyranose hydrolase [Syntrophomonas sp.]